MKDVYWIDRRRLRQINTLSKRANQIGVLFRYLLLTDPVGFFQPVGVKIKNRNSIWGIDIPMFFMAGDLNSIDFNS